MTAPSYLVRALAEHRDRETPVFNALLAEHVEGLALVLPDFEIPATTTNPEVQS